MPAAHHPGFAGFRWRGMKDRGVNYSFLRLKITSETVEKVPKQTVG
jgi:hypothetical protein